MPTRPLPLALLALLALSGGEAQAVWVMGDKPSFTGRPAQGGVVMGDKPGLHPIRLKGVQLVPRHGRPVDLPLPRPLLLDDGLLIPAGDWAELRLTLDGPLVLSWGDEERRLSVQELWIPLEDPASDAPRRLWLDLPPLDGSLSDDALLRQIEDGALLVSDLID